VVSLADLDGVPVAGPEGHLGVTPRGHQALARVLLPAVEAALRAHDAEVWSREATAEALAGSPRLPAPTGTAGGPSLQG
jgi:hypothetical protein